MLGHGPQDFFRQIAGGIRGGLLAGKDQEKASDQCLGPHHNRCCAWRVDSFGTW
jgi:hypothetical protein